MKRLLYLTLMLAVVFSMARQISEKAARADEKNAFTPDSIPWGPAPPTVPAGAQMAVLEGNPAASTGDYTVRLKMPDGYRFPPHWHPKRENVTVLSGTFKVGMGDTFEVDKMGSFPAGSFAYLDPDMHHYAMASGAVVVQVHGQAPFQIQYVNPQDDPMKK
jgi:quercetin dioxygenase-like cupin family protein